MATTLTRERAPAVANPKHFNHPKTPHHGSKKGQESRVSTYHITSEPHKAGPSHRQIFQDNTSTV